MNKLGISNKDWINLSAYIDGALSEQERACLDERLGESKDLQQELANLQRLKAAVRALPAKKAPRDFMLNPAMVKVRKQQTKLFASLRLASVAATILFLVAFAGEALLKGQIFQNLQTAAPAMEAALSMDEEVAAHLPNLPNRPEVLGAQYRLVIAGNHDRVVAVAAEVLLVGAHHARRRVEQPLARHFERRSERTGDGRAAFFANW